LKKSLRLAAILAAFAMVVGLAIIAAVRLTRSATNAPAERATLSAKGPCSGIKVAAGSSIQAAIDSHPEGATFCIAAGVHRLSEPLEPKDGQRFIGEGEDAVLSGAHPLKTWRREGRSWGASGQTIDSAEGPDRGAPGSQECRYQEDVFLDDTRLVRVLSLSELRRDSFFFDYDADKIYLADDPSGHRLEVARIPAAFVAGGDGIILESLTVEKFANPGGGPGAIDAKDASDWTITNVLVRLNHGRGVTLGNGTKLSDSKLLHNGQLGAGGTPKNASIKGNEIAFNNELDFSGGWAAGGLKAGEAEQVEIAENNVHDNRGSGIWLDEESRDVTIRKNRVTGNRDSGIHYEISCRGRIVENEVENNGAGSEARQGRGAGIQIVASHDVEVQGNTVRGNQNGITVLGRDRGPAGDCRRRTSNVSVRSNRIWLAGDRDRRQRVGLWDADDPVEGIGVTFTANQYCLEDLSQDHFFWKSPVSRQEWQRLGQDDSGDAAFRRGGC
jgi:parallel beta-helix repeat protein